MLERHECEQNKAFEMLCTCNATILLDFVSYECIFNLSVAISMNGKSRIATQD